MKSVLDLQKMHVSGGIIHKEWELPGNDGGSSSASSTLFILPHSFSSFVC